MKLKYRNSDGEIICMGEMPGLTAGDGETVIDIDAAIPSPLPHYRYNNGIVSKSAEEIAAIDALANFKSEIAVGRMYEVFAAEAVALAPYFGAIKDLMAWKNFSGLKLFIEGMVTAQIITQDQANSFKSILSEQNIDLDEF